MGKPRLTTGLWRSEAALMKLDARRQPLKGMRDTQRALSAALGGDPSPQQSILVDRAVYLLYRITAAEERQLHGMPSTSPIDANYLAWVGSLRRVLESLGLERKARDLPSLQDYLRDKEQGKQNGSQPA